MDATCGFARHGALVDGPALRLRTGGGAPSRADVVPASRGDIARPGVAAVPTTSQGTSLPVARRFLTS